MEDLKITDDDPVRSSQSRMPLAWAISSRRTGIGSKKDPAVPTSIKEIAENKLIDKGSDTRPDSEEIGRWRQGFELINCQLGPSTRSTFLMVFSPDKTLMASTHGDHNIYITQTKTGRCIQTLKGHPRTPWCIEFHPSHKGVIASGCLGGQVRVWDLHGGSEMWCTEGGVSSLTFHPIEKFLVIATFNEIHFWDWKDEAPKLKITTCNEKEKVRYVKFDRLGHQLITGIANFNTGPRQTGDRTRGAPETPTDGDVGGGGDIGGPGDGLDPNHRASPAYYSSVMQRYERLMHRYFRNRHDTESADRPAGEGGREPAREAEEVSSTLPSPRNLPSNGSFVDVSPRYRRYSLLLDREDLDAPLRGSPEVPRFRPTTVGRAHRATQGGRDSLPRVRLRRVSTFREPDNGGVSTSRSEARENFRRETEARTMFREGRRRTLSHLSDREITSIRYQSREDYLRQLRQRMLEARRLRRAASMAREALGDVGTRGVDGEGGVLGISSVMEETNTNFQHSTGSEFVPVPDNPSQESWPRGGRVLDIVGPPERTQDLVSELNSGDVPLMGAEPDAVNSPSEPPAFSLPSNLPYTSPSVSVLFSSSDTSSIRNIDATEANGAEDRSYSQEMTSLRFLADRMRRISRLSQSGVTIRPRGLGGAGIDQSAFTSSDQVQRVTLSVGDSGERGDNNNSGAEGGSLGSQAPEPNSTQLMEDGLVDSYRQGLERRRESRASPRNRSSAPPSNPADERFALSPVDETREEREFGPSTRRIDVSLADMSPPVSIPVLTPSQIVVRMERRENQAQTDAASRSPLIHSDVSRSPLLSSESSRLSDAPRSTALEASRCTESTPPAGPLDTSRSSTAETTRSVESSRMSVDSPRVSVIESTRSLDTSRSSTLDTSRSSVLDTSRYSVSTLEAGRSPGSATETGRSPTRSLEAGRSPGRSFDPSRSPGRSPGRSFEPDGLTMLRCRINRGRRATADAPSSSAVLTDRMSVLQGEFNNGSQIGENPFTSRPPSSASEIEIELPSNQNSAVSSPIPRPLTARGRYSADVDSALHDTGRNSADSLYRRSFSSDHGAQGDPLIHPPTPADVTAVEPIEDDFASDSSSSRPGSRLERPDSRQNLDTRRPFRLSMFMFHSHDARSRQSRRNTLSRLMEEESGFVAESRERSLSLTSPIPDTVSRERATSASSALASPLTSYPGVSPRADSDSTEPRDSDIRDAASTDLAPTDTSVDQENNEASDINFEITPPFLQDMEIAPLNPGEPVSELDIGGEVPVAAPSDLDRIDDQDLPVIRPPAPAAGQESDQNSSDDVTFTLPSGTEAVSERMYMDVGSSLVLDSEDEVEMERSRRLDNLLEAGDRTSTAVVAGQPQSTDLVNQRLGTETVAANVDAANTRGRLTEPDLGQTRATQPQTRRSSVSEMLSSSQQTNPSETNRSNISDETNRRHNLDISLLARHIEHMQRICRASLEDLPQSRQRRQVIRLQGIRRMLEDLHRQIRTLQSTVQGAASGALEDNLDNTSITSPTRGMEFTAIRPRRRSGHIPNRSQTGVLSNRSRLTRAQSALFSRLHATVRAMEMSPDLARRGISPVNDSLTEASQSVMESHEQQQLSASLNNRISPPVNSSSLAGRDSSRSFLRFSDRPSTSPGEIAELARNGLRSMSQRLERLLRERREAIEMNIHREVSDAEPDQRSMDITAPLSTREGLEALPPNLLDDTSSDSSDSEEERLLVDSQTQTRGYTPFSRTQPSRTSFSRRRDRMADILYLESLQALRRSGRESSNSSLSSRIESRLSGGPVRDGRFPSFYRDIPLTRGTRRHFDSHRTRTAERLLERRLRNYGSNTHTDRLPPLSDLIWRRLRRRIGNDDEDDRDRTRNRETIREMVDQLSIDHDPADPDSFGSLGSTSNLGLSSGAPPPPSPQARRPQVEESPAYRSLPRMYQRLNRMSYMARLDERHSRNMRRDFPPMYNNMHMSTSNITYRIQTWDFWGEGIPDISRPNHNVVVKEAKIHNDASVDISEDGRMLVTLAPCNLPMTTVVGLYSLEKKNLGHVLATYSLESCAVSVSLSPTSRHLLVGLTTKSRLTSLGLADRSLMAQVFRIKPPAKEGERGRLVHRKDIHQVEQGHMSLNCIRWIPEAGRGLVFATNTGLLGILR